MAKGYPDFEGPKVGVYLQPEWAAKEGTDKNYYGSRAGDPDTWTVAVQVVVTSGKTLYICHLGGAVIGEAANVVLQLYDATNIDTLYVSGGAQGFATSLNKPIAAEGGTILQLRMKHYGTASRAVLGYVGGYEK